jgi:hypothetical protein
MFTSKFAKPIEAEFKRTNLRAFHLAGIIPADIYDQKFGMLWDDVLMPIAPNYPALEHAVYVAAWAGCESIWIVVSADKLQIVKKLIGDYVNDPVELVNDRPGRTVQNHKGKKIPVFFISPQPRDRVRYRGLVWSILWGATVAQHVSRKVSWWLEPDSYFVSFPQGLFSYNLLREHRRSDISSKHRFYVSYKGRTVRNGLHLPFTFRSYDLRRFKVAFKMQTTSKYEYKKDEDGIEWNELPYSEQYSGKTLDLIDVFFNAVIGPKSKVVESRFYYPLDTFEMYCNYCASPDKAFFKRPKSLYWSSGHYRTSRDLTEQEKKREEQ